MDKIKNGIFKNNPIFVLMLGLCTVLAGSINIEQALIMGISLTFILFFSNTIVSMLKNVIGSSIRIPAYIIIIATFVTIVEMILMTYLPDFYDHVGIYISLLVVNCVVLGRAMHYASNNKVVDTMLDSIGIGLGFTLSLMLIAFFRELLSSGTITIIDQLSSIFNFTLKFEIMTNENYLLSIFNKPAGAFLIIGFILAISNYIRQRRTNK